MKKLMLFAAIAVFGLSNVNAQNFNGGIGVGLPTGDASDFLSFSINADLSYTWNVSDSFDVGLASGLIYVFGKDWEDGPNTIKVDDGQYLPLAATGKLKVSDKFFILADLGYAIGINEDNDGGFYYRPGVGYGISDNMSINLSYTGVSQDYWNYNSINLGLGFKF